MGDDDACFGLGYRAPLGGQKLSGDLRPDPASGTVKVLRLEKIEDIFEAIRFLRVRGAPPSGFARVMPWRLLLLVSKRKIIKTFWPYF